LADAPLLAYLALWEVQSSGYRLDLVVHPAWRGRGHEACVIAKARGEYAGYSALAVTDRARTQAGSGGTAVRPEYRGIGIATTLKAGCIRWARDNGVRQLATASGNPAMVHVNEKFGFRRTYVEVRLVRRF
jgi:GNAT superfamily N-acetyltransferase